jgi:hypothetical protein
MDQTMIVLRSQVTKFFGPAFPKVQFRIFPNPLRVEVFGIHHRGLDLVCRGGHFVPNRVLGPGEVAEPLSPHEFDFGHFHECCQAIQALLGVQVVIYDFSVAERLQGLAS